MANSSQQEMIWQGRLQLGDEPGIFGDAAYTGLCAELPFTIFRADPAAQDFKLVLATDDLDTFQGYPGHEITVFTYLPDPNQPFHSIQQVLATARFLGTDQNKKEVSVTVGSGPGPFFLSLRLRIDTTVNPGLYDDFVWRKLSLKATNFQFFASFGFVSPQ
jgi:hypothetical protein